MKTIISFLICLMCLPVAAQKKIMENNYNFSTSSYTIDRQSKLKEGKYVKIRNSNHDTLVTGQYENDRKVGLWKYRSSGNKNYITYNYDSKSAEYLDPAISKVDSFLTIEGSNGMFFLNKVDSPPIYLGFPGEIKVLLARNINLPVTEMQRGLEGSTTASFVISRTGAISNIKIERSLNRTFDKIVLDAIKLIDSEWIPAKVNNIPTDAKINVLVRVSNSKKLSKPKDQPYEIVILQTYSGVRTKRSVTGTVESQISQETF
jgi:hypothetical protein